MRNDYLLKGDENTEGLFPNERTVQFKDNDGHAVSVTVSNRKVVQRNGGVYLRVRLIRHEDNAAVVVLPGEVYGAGRIVAVKSERLEPVA